MMRLQQVTTATPATVPSTQPVAASKPSFKGKDMETDGQLLMPFDNYDYSKENAAEPTPEETWTGCKNQFQELAENPEHPSFIKNLGKAGVVVATGVLGYLSARVGMRKCADLISTMIKSKQMQAATAQVSKFATETLGPSAKSVSKMVSKKADAVTTGIKTSSLVNFISEKLALIVKKTSFAQKRKLVAGEQALSSVKTKMTDLVSTAKSKIPTLEQFKGGVIQTLAIGSGMAAAMTGSEVAKKTEEKIEAAV